MSLLEKAKELKETFEDKQEWWEDLDFISCEDALRAIQPLLQDAYEFIDEFVKESKEIVTNKQCCDNSEDLSGHNFMPIFEKQTYLHSICTRCGKTAKG